MMSWKGIKSEEELRKKFKFQEVYTTMLKETGLQGVVTIKGFKSLYAFIVFLQKYFFSGAEELLDNNIHENNIQILEEEFFKSEIHKQAYMLLNYNASFSKELGITNKHYVDKKLAKEWRNYYIKIFHTDQGSKFKDQEDIVNQINKLYARMVGEA